MISLQHINKRFRKLQALQDVSIDFNAGEVVALIGPNGSGKTTLIKSILGLVQPDSGTIIFNGASISRQPDYRREIGYMPQIGRYPDNMRIGQVFDMLKNIRKEPLLDEELYYRFKLDTMADKPMRTLSGGTRQKVSAALAFLFHPPVLILDEPTAGLDPLSAEILKEKIAAQKEQGRLVLITSHVLSDLEDMVTHAVYMQEGQVLFHKSVEALQDVTGEERLGRAIASMLHHKGQRREVAYLKIAN